ncbi:unnamed protein product, partial [Meganyctiphanes norvegica]
TNLDIFCQEMFTTPILKKIIRDKIEYKKIFQNHGNTSSWKTLRKDNPPFTFAPYEAIARTLPTLLTEELELIESKPQVLPNFPWLECSLRHYDMSASEQCVKQGHRAPRVLLLGDSRVREVALQLLRNWQHLNLTVITQRGSLAYDGYINAFKDLAGLPWMGADKKTRIDFVKHSDIHITTELAPELSISYVYSSFLTESQRVDSGLLKPSIVQVLRGLLDTPAHILPKLLVIGTGTWAIYGDKAIRDGLSRQPELLRNLDWLLQSITHAEKELRGILQQLKEKGVSIIWMLPDNVKHNVTDWKNKGWFTSPVYEFFFEWINEILLNTLMNFQVEDLVTLWDSNHIISSQVIQSCRQLLRSESGWTLGTSEEWGCQDITHSGPQAAQRYAQILLNYLCNDQRHLCCGNIGDIFTH